MSAPAIKFASVRARRPAAETVARLPRRIQQIVMEEAERAGLAPSAIYEMGEHGTVRQKKPLTRLRRRIAVRLRNELSLSYPLIARWLLVDNGSVLYYMKLERAAGGSVRERSPSPAARVAVLA